MVFDFSKIEDLDYKKRIKTDKNGGVCYETRKGKVFLVLHKNTIEVRTDKKLRDVLCERYESVMVSRYFGKGGIEFVLETQLIDSEVVDLIRLSYKLSN